jgi:general secretion pathway protein L
MLAGFFSWWFARLTELLPNAWTNQAVRMRAGIIVDVGAAGDVTVSIRHSDGRLEPVSLGIAVRLAGRKPILLRPPAGAVLVKHHTVPTAPRRQLDQLLRHELARITPFPADDLFWRWDGHPKPGDKARTAVTLTIVPKMVLAPALAALENVGLKAHSVETGPGERPRLLPIGDPADRSSGTVLIRGLAGACACLAVAALVLPFGLQALALHRTEAGIAELQPAIAQVDATRKGIAAGDAGRDILTREQDRTGDVLQTLATVTRILPDDTYLTDFALRERHMTLSGRSASAPRLITALSADPAIVGPAFAAPVTRIEGATSDAFSIKAEIAK